MKRLLAVVGDYYHPEQHLRRSLEAVLSSLRSQGSYELEFIATDQIVDALQDNPDCLILSKENRLRPRESETDVWLTDEVEKAIIRYVDEGGSLLAWHSGLANYGRDSAFTRMVGGFFDYHPKEHQRVTYRTQGSPAQTEFVILDEHYFVGCDTEHTEVFLVSESIDGTSIAGWRHPYGKGKVCCFTPAHRLDGLLDREVVSYMRSNIEWCCYNE